MQWLCSWGLVAAAYALFLAAHLGAVASPARSWTRSALTLAALLLIAAGFHAMRRARRGVGRAALDDFALEALDAAVRPLDAVSPDLAVVFVGRLYALGPAGWALVAAIVREQAGPRAGARAVLCTAVADLRLEGAERHLAYVIAAMVNHPGATRMPPASHAVACTAATSAALAVLLRPSISPYDFDVLYEPFAGLIPATFTGSSRAAGER